MVLLVMWQTGVLDTITLLGAAAVMCLNLHTCVFEIAWDLHYTQYSHTGILCSNSRPAQHSCVYVLVCVSTCMCTCAWDSLPHTHAHPHPNPPTHHPTRGDPRISKNLIILELIKIIWFCLKIWNLWRIPHPWVGCIVWWVGGFMGGLMGGVRSNH